MKRFFKYTIFLAFFIVEIDAKKAKILYSDNRTQDILILEEVKEKEIDLIPIATPDSTPIDKGAINTINLRPRGDEFGLLFHHELHQSDSESQRSSDSGISEDKVYKDDWNLPDLSAKSKHKSQSSSGYFETIGIKKGDDFALPEREAIEFTGRISETSKKVDGPFSLEREAIEFTGRISETKDGPNFDDRLRRQKKQALEALKGIGINGIKVE